MERAASPVDVVAEEAGLALTSARADANEAKNAGSPMILKQLLRRSMVAVEAEAAETEKVAAGAKAGAKAAEVALVSASTSLKAAATVEPTAGTRMRRPRHPFHSRQPSAAFRVMCRPEDVRTN